MYFYRYNRFDVQYIPNVCSFISNIFKLNNSELNANNSEFKMQKKMQNSFI